MAGIWEARPPQGGAPVTAASVWEYDLVHGMKPHPWWLCPTHDCPVVLHHRNGTDSRASSFVHPRRTEDAPEQRHVIGCDYDFAAVAARLRDKHGDVVNIRHGRDPNRVGLDLHVGVPKNSHSPASYRREVLRGAASIAAFIARHRHEPLVLARFRAHVGSRYIPWEQFSYGPSVGSLRRLHQAAVNGLDHPVFLRTVLAHNVREEFRNKKGGYSVRVQPADADDTIAWVHTPPTVTALVGRARRGVAVLSDTVGIHDGLLTVGVGSDSDILVVDR